MVVSLVKNQSVANPTVTDLPTPSSLPADVTPESHRPGTRDQIPPAADPGTLKLRQSGANYVHGAHWEAVLDKVRGLKEDVAEHHVLSGSHMFYGPKRSASREEILAALPARPIVDRLVALHFDSFIITPCSYILFSVLLSRCLLDLQTSSTARSFFERQDSLYIRAIKHTDFALV